MTVRISQGKVAPSRERELKPTLILKKQKSLVAPSRERELKRIFTDEDDVVIDVAPSRERELKQA